MHQGGIDSLVYRCIVDKLSQDDAEAECQRRSWRTTDCDLTYIYEEDYDEEPTQLDIAWMANEYPNDWDE